MCGAGNQTQRLAYVPKYSATKRHLEKNGYYIDKCLEGPHRPRNVCVPCGVALPTEGAHPGPLKRHQAGCLGKGKMLRTKNLNGLKLEEEGLVGQQRACEKAQTPPLAQLM